MKSHSKAYEQYCCIMKKNVVIEETTYHDGRRKFVCTMQPQCVECKNIILKYRLDNEKINCNRIDI